MTPNVLTLTKCHYTTQAKPIRISLTVLTVPKTFLYHSAKNTLLMVDFLSSTFCLENGLSVLLFSIAEVFFQKLYHRVNGTTISHIVSKNKK